VPPERRDLAMVFQSYALYPHKTVRDNLAFGLRMRRLPAPEIRARVERTAAALGIAPLLDRRPSQLSGGQRQRVALGRAIVREPRAFLFDEPLSNLDPRLRGETRVELVELHGRLGATMVYVTHDQEEAMTLGQRIAVLRDGAIEQVAAPRDVYLRPATVFVAQFVGSPPMNLFALDAPAMRQRFDPPEPAVRAGVRPHDVECGPAGAGLDAQIEVVELTGPTQHLHLRAGGDRVLAVVPGTPLRHPGERVGLTFDRRHVHFFDRDGRRVDTTEHAS
jgi:ABC-type sugar transport system ATPase subunit